MNQIKAELIKLRRGKVWIAFMAIPLIPALFGTVNYLGNIEILTSLWDSLWTQHTLFSCYFFAPMLMGIYCAYLWRMEHCGSNWNQVLSMPVSPMALILAKMLLGFAMSALMLVWTFLLYLVSGMLIGLPLSVLPPALLLWFLGGLLGAFAICSLQIFLGLIFRSFAVSVGIALLGGIGGLMMLSKGWGLFCPYSLLSYGMRANGAEVTGGYPTFVGSCLLFIALFVSASALWMKRRMTK